MNQTISVIIIEDDEEALTYLSSLLEELFSNIDIIATCGNIKDSIKLLNDLNPELVFMDIELTDGDAFQILNATNNYDFEVIFVTAHNNYIEKSIEYYAFSFLTKPIDITKLNNLVKRYINLKKRFFTKQKYVQLKELILESKLLINTGNKHISLNINDIVKCKAEGNYCLFSITNKSTHLASKPLKYYENLLLEKGFFRANRSTLINIRKIHSIYKKETIILDNKEKIMVSARNKSKLSELIKNLS